MISMKTKYALMALTALARSTDREALLIADLARTENIPKKFLEAILLALKNQGIPFQQKRTGGRVFAGGGTGFSYRRKECVHSRVISHLSRALPMLLP